MKRKLALRIFVAAGCISSLTERSPAQDHEVGLTLIGLKGAHLRTSADSINIGAGIGFGANYGYRFFVTRQIGISGEAQLLTSPLQGIESNVRGATHDFAGLYVVPGIRASFRPSARLSPYVVIGGGYALFEQSLTRIDGAVNQAPRYTHRGALAYGGGIDVRVWRFVSARWEVRDYYSGNPSLNVRVTESGLHNVAFGAGIVLRKSRKER